MAQDKWMKEEKLNQKELSMLKRIHPPMKITQCGFQTLIGTLADGNRTNIEKRKALLHYITNKNIFK